VCIDIIAPAASLNNDSRYELLRSPEWFIKLAAAIFEFRCKYKVDRFKIYCKFSGSYDNFRKLVYKSELRPCRDFIVIRSARCNQSAQIIACSIITILCFTYKNVRYRYGTYIFQISYARSIYNFRLWSEY